MELLKQNLAIEPDLQNFLRFGLMAVSCLGGNSFAASLATLDMSQRLRKAGVGTGYPVSATLSLDGTDLVVAWNGGERIVLCQFREPPGQAKVSSLRQQLQQSTEIADPALLRRRNAEMMRYLDETRERTERELAALQASLEARQNELRESLRQAETDPLTGLLNRRAFDERLGVAFRRTMRQRSEPMSLVMLDLDYFKQINDEYGHQYGDAYLNKMAQAMMGVIRHEVDEAFRFGGDEFALLIFADAKTACRKAHHVLQDMGGKVSIGIASIGPSTQPELSLEDFVRKADDALYQAKREGRGRVVIENCCPNRKPGCDSHCATIALVA